MAPSPTIFIFGMGLAHLCASASVGFLGKTTFPSRQTREADPEGTALAAAAFTFVASVASVSLRTFAASRSPEHTPLSAASSVSEIDGG